MAFLLRDVVFDHAHHQGQADAHGKGHGHARDVDGRHQQDISQVEDQAAQQGRGDVTAGRVLHVVEKTAALAAVASQREGRHGRQQHHAKNVVPIEEFEPPAAGELLGVGPGTPAEHGDDAQSDRKGIAVNHEHGAWTFSGGKASRPARR